MRTSLRSPLPLATLCLHQAGTRLRFIFALIAKIGQDEKIYTSLFDEALYKIPELVDYRIFLSRNTERDSMLCKVETLGKGDGIADRVTGQLLTIQPIAGSIEAGLMTRPEIEVVAQGVLRRGGRSLKRRIVDNR
jgi:phenylacetate-coenzyme A ligase PaaK-like adenylate-forming protein